MISEHLNGTIYIYVPAYYWARVDGKFAKTAPRKPGVKIIYPDGVKRFISNDWYDG